MNAGSPVVMLDRSVPALAERAAAILRDEIASGALANIAAASRVWSMHRRDLIIAEATRRLAAEVGGLVDAVLDLLAPPPASSAASSLPPVAAVLDYGGALCVVPTQGLLKPPASPGSDREGEFVEGDHHSPGHWLLGGQLVLPSPQVLDEGMPGDDHSGVLVLLEPTHRSQPRLQPAVVALDTVLAYCSVRCHAAGNSSSSTTGNVPARSVITSTGATFVVAVARSKNRRAAVMSRLRETNTSMTWPN